eukprot:2868085-Karenia_brevis.AAC.1
MGKAMANTTMVFSHPWNPNVSRGAPYPQNQNGGSVKGPITGMYERCMDGFRTMAQEAQNKTKLIKLGEKIGQ